MHYAMHICMQRAMQCTTALILGPAACWRRVRYTVNCTAHHTMHNAACVLCRAQGWQRLPPLRLLQRRLQLSTPSRSQSWWPRSRRLPRSQRQLRSRLRHPRRARARRTDTPSARRRSPRAKGRGPRGASLWPQNGHMRIARFPDTEYRTAVSTGLFSQNIKDEEILHLFT